MLQDNVSVLGQTVLYNFPVHFLMTKCVRVDPHDKRSCHPTNYIVCTALLRKVVIVAASLLLHHLSSNTFYVFQVYLWRYILTLFYPADMYLCIYILYITFLILILQCMGNVRCGFVTGPNGMVTALCSEGPMFRRLYVQNVLCSEGPMFRRFYVQKVLYSEGSMFRRFCVQKYLFRRSYV